MEEKNKTIELERFYAIAYQLAEALEDIGKEDKRPSSHAFIDGATSAIYLLTRLAETPAGEENKTLDAILAELEREEGYGQ